MYDPPHPSLIIRGRTRSPCLASGGAAGAGMVLIEGCTAGVADEDPVRSDAAEDEVQIISGSA
eukprot:2946661-Pleurochrysis_carterae.AAC.2